MGSRFGIPAFFNPAGTSYVLDFQRDRAFGGNCSQLFRTEEKGNELLREGGGSCCTEETCVPKGNKESCANPLSKSVDDSVFKKMVIFTGSRFRVQGLGPKSVGAQNQEHFC